MFPGSQIIVSPAYGKDYKSQKEVLEAWNAGKDFTMENRPQSYINKTDAESYGVPGGTIKVHYKGKRQIMFIKGLPVNNSM